jgi:PelA/Pel-15E family pectate lyase
VGATRTGKELDMRFANHFHHRTMHLAVMLVLAAGQVAHAQWGGGQSRWGNILDYPDGYYGSEESIRVAQNVLVFQNPNGSWPKNTDMARKLSASEKARIRKNRAKAESGIDNGATWTQIRYLALMHDATGEDRFARAVRRGIEYLLAAQYPNGGWPQFYPLRRGYYSHITYNDGAMMGVMNVLHDVAEGNTPFEFVDSEQRERCRTATEKGLDVILKTQVVVDGQPTAWCAQYDEATLQPASARAFEPVSLSGYESVGIVEYLMRLDNPSPEIKRSIEGAMEWFERVKIEGQRVDWVFDEETGRRVDRVVIEDPAADPIWARFYEIDTNRPMFIGRDSVVREHLADIEQERRLGYAYLGDWPDKLLEKKYPQWREKWNR